MADPTDLITRLVQRMESHGRTLHRYEARYDCCKRLMHGLGFSGPEDCDCGLDPLLAEAHEFIETAEVREPQLEQLEGSDYL